LNYLARLKRPRYRRPDPFTQALSAEHVAIVTVQNLPSNARGNDRRRPGCSRKGP
jgi:hypothetical protein